MKIVSNGKTLEVSGCVGGGEIYSTEETRIGTWIDGKPLYRKVVVIEQDALKEYGTGINIPILEVNHDVYDIKILSGTVHAKDGAIIPMPISYVTGSIGKGNNVVYMLGHIHVCYSFESHKNGETNIFIEYTKETD